MNTKFISQADLAGLVADLVGAGTKVIAPVATRGGASADYRSVQKLEEAAA